jgi:nucleotide-binding universal stress UspA family protein
MYKRILVPLDGSELAECVLPHVIMLARAGTNTKITLIRVVPPLKLYGGFDYAGMEAATNAEMIQRIENDNTKDAKDYLTRQLNQLKAKRIGAKAEVGYGGVAEIVSEVADKKKADLIVIATHGRSGVSRLFLGSVAERIMRTSKVPILMIRPPGS